MSVHELNQDDFQKEILNSEVPVLVDFHSVFCAPCQALKPLLAELANDLGDRAKVFTVEISMNERLTAQYGISFLPTLIVFKSGKELHRLVGLKSKDYLRKALDV